jgi:asparagine synthase (glutamine-hydrolysing)
MCGICGSIGIAEISIIEVMNNAIRHCGLDDHGCFIDQEVGIALGHRRLAIIDRSPAGKQPISYANGRYWITYNGEVYNYLTLRNAIEGLGHSSDRQLWAYMMLLQWFDHYQCTL